MRRNDLTNKKFGKLTVLAECKERSCGHIVWECLCECGRKINVAGIHLVSGHTTSCGCAQKQMMRDRFNESLIGMRFGRLCVVDEAGRDKYGRKLWSCKCDCGEKTIATGQMLKSGNKKSCGCLSKEVLISRNFKHGLCSGESVHPLFSVWADMQRRCNNPRCAEYKNYGGRGISICSRWKRFDNFVTDMGERPGEDYSIDRIDNNGNYEPENCRWATKVEQCNNTRRNKFYFYKGEMRTIATISRMAGLPYSSVRKKLMRGVEL